MKNDLNLALSIIGGMQFLSQFIGIPIIFQAITISTLTIYMGAKLSKYSSEDKHEIINKNEAMLMPIYGSAVLLGSYMLLRIVPASIVVFIARIYVCIIGYVLTVQQLKQFFSIFLNDKITERYKNTKKHINLSLVNKVMSAPAKKLLEEIAKIQPYKEQFITNAKKYTHFIMIAMEKIEENFPSIKETFNQENLDTTKEYVYNSILPEIEVTKKSLSKDDIVPEEITINMYNIIIYGASFAICTLYFFTKSLILSNILGFIFSLQAIQSVAIDSCLAAFVLLGGLFFYDIFWVFFTDVMKTVAISLDIPIKFIFFRYDGSPAMLGLGDIIVPGTFITLMYRYDLSLKKTKSNFTIDTPVDDNDYKQLFIKYFNIIRDWSYTNDTIAYQYFNISLLGYIFGLIVSFIFMVLTKSAQPALLYLVPSLLGATLGNAYYNGQQELEKLITYNDSGISNESNKSTETVDKKDDDIDTKCNDDETKDEVLLDQVVETASEDSKELESIHSPKDTDSILSMSGIENSREHLEEVSTM